jgi:hypothetical protein
LWWILVLWWIVVDSGLVWILVFEVDSTSFLVVLKKKDSLKYDMRSKILLGQNQLSNKHQPNKAAIRQLPKDLRSFFNPNSSSPSAPSHSATAEPKR